jgi:hypothetical protein
MAYTKTVWQARQGTGLNRFVKSGETAAEVTLVNAPTGITQAGTPFSVENMNHLEQGVFDAHDLIAELQNADSFGYLILFPFEPSAFMLSALKALPLAGQPILISDYQRLCEAAYVGDALNATAEAWYKTSDEQGNVRDPSGAYMRVLDHRGLFSRGSGINGIHKMANNQPYTGGAIGEFIGDAFQWHAHDIKTYSAVVQNVAGGVIPGYNGAGDYSTEKYASAYLPIAAYNSGEPRLAQETRGASISHYGCIKY